MPFQEKIYGGKLFRPKPEVYMEKDESLFLLASPWGRKEISKKAIEIVESFISSMKQEREVTSPFEELTCLHPLGNDIRTSLMLANDYIFQNENKEEYSSGIEIFVLIRTESMIYWGQVGHLHLFLDRMGSPLFPLEVSSDFSLEMSSKDSPHFAPFPKSLLGLASTSNFSIKELAWQKKDRLIFMHRSQIPSGFYSLSHKERTIENIAHICAKDHELTPFWLGVFEL